jgi:dihydrofolate reductase
VATRQPRGLIAVLIPGDELCHLRRSYDVNDQAKETGMTQVILQMGISIDGFAAAVDGSQPWLGEPEDDAAKQWKLDTVRGADAHLMGRVTYLDMAAHWPGSESAYAAPMNDIPKVVFSKTLNSATWAETRIAGGPLEEEIESIKARPGGYVIAYGGARFARALIRGGLVDEYRLNIQPAALGTGMPIFTELREPLKLELVEARAFAGGNVGHVYKPRSS